MQSTTLERREPQAVEPKRQERRLTFTPFTDILETAEALVLLADMPGVDDGSVEVTIEQRILTVVGRTQPSSREGYRLVHREHRSGDFRRTFHLSQAVDVDGIEATVKDGLLTVTVPKAAAERSRSIEVKAL